MKRRSKTSINYVYQFLLFIFAIILIIICIGSILALKKKNRTEKKEHEKPLAAEIRGNKALYSDIGRIRVRLSGNIESTLVIFPVIEYRYGDKAFEEELVQKKELIKEVLIDWFSKKNVYELYSMKDTEIKEGILVKINSILILSKVKHIYFKEFIILE